MKKHYGVTPWGSWFIDVLQSYGIGSRLARGRTYANTGRVLSLEINTCRAAAKVEGHYRSFYWVLISFPPLKEAERVYRMIEEDPPLLARIASGELPESFLLDLKKNNINLIPPRWRDMKRSCTCPDDADPCKHMAALYYIIAREIDADPHALFRLRGMDLTERFGKAAVHRVAPPFAVTFAKDGEEDASFRKAADVPPFLEEIPHCAGLITTLLPPSPPFCARDFAAVTADFYRLCARSKTREDNGTETDSAMEHDFSRSRWTLSCLSPEGKRAGVPRGTPGPGAEVFLDAEDINGNIRRFTPYAAFERFMYFSSEDGSASYSFLFYLFKFLNLVCGAGAFIPYVLVENGTLKIIWRPFETLPPVSAMLESIAAFAQGSLQVILQKEGRRKTGGQKLESRFLSGRSAVDLVASGFLTEWVSRRAFAFRKRLAGRGSGFDFQELFNLFFGKTTLDVSSPARRSLPQIIDRWLSVLHIDFTAHRYNLVLREASPKQSEEEDLFFSLSMNVIIEREEGREEIPLSKCGDLDVLLAPTALSNYLPEIRTLVRRVSVRLSELRLVAFLDSAASLLTRLGMDVILPKILAKELRPRLVVRGKSSGSSLNKYFDLKALQDFEWQIAVGGEILSPSEFENLLREKRSLVRFRDGFVKINPEELSRLLKKANGPEPDFNDFLRAHFSGDSVLSYDAREVMNNLFREQNIPVPPELNAELRPYQKRGYNWVCSLLLSGFGCILADDMGLGKTVQSIAALLYLKEEGLLPNGCLIIAPAPLLNNWEKELGRFAPALAVSRYHGQRRIINRAFDVFLTTYQTAAQDAEKLKDLAFSMLLVDEAHLLKNADSRISRTVKHLRSQYRLALSGTPVENRLEDLRSLFDFILPGYLGTAPAFRELYRVPIEVMRNRTRAEALKKITSPFLLRRLKTDKTIIEDLPEKIIANEYAVLEREQAALYKSVVDESMEKTARLAPKERSSLIFALLTSLKQICDHPRVFDKESPAVSSLSGKAQLLLALLEEIIANREKTLVFSQYVETLDCLDLIIRKELGEAPLLYHGALSQKARTETINRFQNDPGVRILLVSLKAGGLGLNLTAASRVIHYDLWYNPAVENQAEDRAFRIGQKRTVFVHRFITKNSFEEKIDAMLESKKELADMTVTSGESWIARMSHQELRELFAR